jgi:hypothetical protein
MKQKPINIKALRELIERYDSLSPNEVNDKWNNITRRLPEDQYGSHACIVANELTGFGKGNTCTLCMAAENICELCVFEELFGCVNKAPKTYKAISNAKNPEQLLKAFKNRARYLRMKFKKLLDDEQQANDSTAVRDTGNDNGGRIERNNNRDIDSVQFPDI